MAVLAVAAAGAAVGSAAFGAATFLGVSAAGWGWAIGSVVGNMLFAPKTNTEGPRLTNVRFSQSSYGATLPIVFGSMRVGGNVVWMGEVREVANKQKIGKNAYSTTYSYLQSFVVAIAEGPIQGVRKIWFDSELVYDASAGGGLSAAQASGPVAEILTIYLGGESQEPSALMEAVEGVGNVPAYRGVALLEFEELDLTKYGNRVPSVTAEVIEAATETVPVTLSSVGFMSDNQSAEIVDGALLTAQWPISFAGDILTAPGAYDKHVTVRSLDGTVLSEVVATGTTLYPYGSSGVEDAAKGCLNDIDIAYGSYASNYFFPEGTTYGAWLLGYLYGENGSRTLVSVDMDGGQNYQLKLGGLMRNETHLYGFSAAGDAGAVIRWPIVNNVPAPQWDKFVPIADLPGVIVGAGGAGFVYVDGDSVYAKSSMTDASINEWIYVFDLDLVHTGTIKNYGPSGDPQFDTFAVWNGQLLYTTQYNDGTYTVTQASIEYDSTGEGTATELGSETNSNNSFYPSSPAFNPIGGGIFLTAADELSMLPTLTPSGRTLADVLTRLSLKVGLSAGEIDVTDVDDITVDGYLLDRRASCRSAIEPLLVAYDVDAVESNGKIAFRSRGAAVVATVAHEDLGAMRDEDVDSQPISTMREHANVLPQQVDVSYSDVDAGYEVGTQTAQRGEVLSEQKVSVDLPIAADADTAVRAANRIIYGLWAARNRREFATDLTYSHLEPADPIYLEEADGTLARLRLVSKLEDDGLIRWEAIDDDDGVPIQIAEGASLPVAPGISPQASGSTLHLFESPPLNDQDADAPNLYAAAIPYSPTTWEGAFLWANAEGGADYTEVGQFSTAAIGGHAVTALRDWTVTKMGDDPAAVQVNVGVGTLSSADDSELAAGANRAILGEEIIQFRNAADEGDGVWTLSGIRRALHGTEQFAVDHEINERFVLIGNSTGDILTARRPVADIGVPREYRAVAPRATVTDAPSLVWTPVGRTMYPLPPGHIRIVRQANGDRTVSWNRRARAQQMWRDYTDMALIESSEVYRVRIYNPYTDATLRTDYVTGATSWTYTSANISTDWPGGRPVLVRVGITQYSENVGYQDEAIAEIVWPQADNPQYGRDWNDGLTTAITTYGGSVTSTVVSGVYRLGTSSYLNDAKAKLDALPTFTNGGAEIDIVVPTGGTERGGGILLRTNNWWAGGNNGFAYEACVDGDGRIQLRRGTETNADTLTTIEQTATGYVTVGETIRLGYFANGNTHLVYVDGELVINATDSTHTSAGYCGLHWRQGQSNTYAEIDNLLVRY